MRESVRPHLFARPLLMALGALFALTVAAQQAAEPARDIKDPHFGDTLFQFFQDHYFASITTLMASQQFGRVSRHAEEAEILRGGMLLSYGLTAQAGEIFESLIQRGATPPTRDRAWFYLAKIRQQRGYLAEAEDALRRIGNALPLDLEEERGLLQAQLMMAHMDFIGAARVLSSMKPETPGARYVRYNLGIALIKSGDTPRGSAQLDALGSAAAENEEFRSLRDRANLALGFAALADNQPQNARKYLERVRLHGMESNKALLGLGWAAAALQEPALALTPWQELTQRDIGDPAVLEAQIAVPYAFAALGAYGQSAERYNAAIAIFGQENKALAESIAEIRTGKLLDTLVASNPGEEMGWFWRVQNLPVVPHPGHLAHVLALHDFQEALKNYRDLRFLARNLEEWRDKLGTFDDMLQTRRKAFTERLPGVQVSGTYIHINPLRERHLTLSETVIAAEVAADGVAFADARQLDLLDRIAFSKATLKTLSNSPEWAQTHDRVRLAEGALQWELGQDYTHRLWQSRKELQTIAAALDAGKAREVALARAQREEPARFDGFAGRIKTIAPLLQTEMARVDRLCKEQARALQDMAIAALERQQERLLGYETQSRFALAQLYDRGAADQTRPDGKKEAGRATAP